MENQRILHFVVDFSATEELTAEPTTGSGMSARKLRLLPLSSEEQIISLLRGSVLQSRGRQCERCGCGVLRDPDRAGMIMEGRWDRVSGLASFSGDH